jgi:hypothetical protein
VTFLPPHSLSLPFLHFLAHISRRSDGQSWHGSEVVEAGVEVCVLGALGRSIGSIPSSWAPRYGVVDIVGGHTDVPGVCGCEVCEVAGVETWMVVVEAYLATGMSPVPFSPLLSLLLSPFSTLAFLTRIGSLAGWLVIVLARWMLGHADRSWGLEQVA